MTTPARAISLKSLNFAPRFEYGEQAEVVEVCGTGDGSELGTGYARFKDAAIPWTVKYDEVVLVLEGHLTIHTAQGDLEAGPHDCIWLPEGTDLTYIAQSALVFYAIQPASWASG